ncbi:TauD/TfdA family dioxygenase [Orrella marina]|uniref:Taurine catabolism dioxygenase TauD n=1 Tax=Orrella marina TaxID=2163011 RepID=A0A2R4XNF7_9BURK|nr:TauD/TfdA family dioxygenase [Orrella marina]AWB35336.1 taurine catabolism dioxygenase TauD [Orrella marina]
MAESSTSATRPEQIAGPSAWLGPQMTDQTDWIHELDAADVQEILSAIQVFRAGEHAFDEISPQTFVLDSLGDKLRRILNEVQHGRGFVLIRGFPVDQLDQEGCAIGYLGMGSYLGAFRSQNAKGHLLGHVRDIGRDIRDANTRYYQTNRALEYHTDSCDIVGLLSLRTARAGGDSRLVSSVSIYNEMMRTRPDLAQVLFNAFPTDRRGEVPPGMLPWFELPVFNWYGGLLTTIYSGQYIRSAQENFPQARRLTALEREALAYMDTLANDPALNMSMAFRPGDIQFIHNHQILHARSDFEDWPEPERKRHLFRLWLAPGDGRPLPPEFAQRYGSVEPGNRGGIVVQGTRLNISLDPV